MTAAETWRYGGDDIPYSMYVGGVGEMPNGSRFIASTGVKLYKEGSQCGAKGVRKARLLGGTVRQNELETGRVVS